MAVSPEPVIEERASYILGENSSRFLKHEWTRPAVLLLAGMGHQQYIEAGSRVAWEG